MVNDDGAGGNVVDGMRSRCVTDPQLSLNRSRLDVGVLSRKNLSISSDVIPAIFVGLDSLMILAVGAISLGEMIGLYSSLIDLYAFAVCFFWIVTLMLLNFAGQYKLDAIMRPFEYLDKVLIAFFTTFAFLLAAIFALKLSTSFSRVWIATFVLGSCTSVLLARYIGSKLLGRLIDTRFLTRKVVLIGDGPQAMLFLTHFARSGSRFVSIVGRFSEGDHSCHHNASLPKMIGNIDDVTPYLRKNSDNVDDVIIALPWSADGKIMELVDKLRELPVGVYLASDLIGFQMQLRQPPDHFGGLRVVEVSGRPLAGWGAVLKPAFDYSLGVVLTLMAIPLMIGIAIAIKIDSQGPVFFRQARYGYEPGLPNLEISHNGCRFGACGDNTAGDTRRSACDPGWTHSSTNEPR